MALKPTDIKHAAQINAGIQGRKRGHEFEFDLAEAINSIQQTVFTENLDKNVFRGNPAVALITFAVQNLGWSQCDHVEAVALGSLATAEEGKKWLEVNGVKVRACKSDILLIFKRKGNSTKTLGVSVKQCNNKTPTNAQLFFTTAHAFCELLRRNAIGVSDVGEQALQQFCGDIGFRPLDDPAIMTTRQIDPRRFFWEETSQAGRHELENIFKNYQNEITRLLLQKAYLNDPFVPEILIHKTRKLLENPQEFALYNIEELISLSKKHQGFVTKKYSVRKGSYKDIVGTYHEAPRFGIVQMQRGGQKQHPTQLQFNLQAGYFYKI